MGEDSGMNRTPSEGAKRTKRLLGQILLDGGFITAATLGQALESQGADPRPLGEILVQMGAITRPELNALLAIQADLASLEDALDSAAGGHMRLGELLVQVGRVTPEDVKSAIEEQRSSGERIGEVLLRRGLITRAELDAVVEFQRRQGAGRFAGSKCRIGEILVAGGFISRDALNEALHVQKASGKRLGEILVDGGYLKRHEVDKALGIQKRLVTAALAAALCLLEGVSMTGVLASGINPALTGPRVTVTAVVPARVSLKALAQTAEIIVTQADISRGFVEVKAATVLEIKNNSQRGYLLAFNGLGGPFMEVIVGGLGTEAHITEDGGWVHQRDSGRAPMMLELSYRFVLSPSAAAGTYAWPLAITATPM